MQLNTRDIPSFDKIVQALPNSADERTLDNWQKAYGDIRTVRVKAQVRYGKEVISEEYLEGLIKDKLMSLTPELKIIEQTNEADATLLFQLFLVKEKRGIYYGFVKVEINRPILISKSGHEMVRGIWGDELPFIARKDPKTEIEELAKLQVTKFAAVWVVSTGTSIKQ